MFKCEIDGKEFKNGGVFAKYLKRIYNITLQEYYHKYIIKNDEIPTCKCGCGKVLKWKSPMGYSEYVHGHASKIKNNWGHNKSAKDKSIDTRNKMFKSGELTVWNKGLTYETSDSVKQYVDLTAESKNNEEYKKFMSTHMKQLWIDGKIKPLFAHDHPNWKGGKSIFQTRARASNRLYKEWKYPILKSSNFTCVECKETTNLHVHHDKESFSQILDIVLKNEDVSQYTEDQIQVKINEIVDYHVINNISGKVLCYECHSKLHPLMNL